MDATIVRCNTISVIDIGDNSPCGRSMTLRSLNFCDAVEHIQAYTCEPTFNGVKMAEYLHPGRGVVKTSDPQR